MRKIGAELLFPTVRREILCALLLHSKSAWYLSELVRHLRRAPSQLHRELLALEEAGLLVRRVEGRQIYFTANSGCFFVEELRAFLEKLFGLKRALQIGLESLGTKVTLAVLLKETNAPRLLVVSGVHESRLLRVVQEVEEALGRAIVIERYTPREVRSSKASDMLSRVLRKIEEDNYLVGSRNTFERVFLARGSNRKRTPRRRLRAT